MDQEITKRLVEQITSLWVGPEIKRRNFKEKIFALLILFKERERPKVLFNFECKFKVTIDPSVGGQLIPGQPVTTEELAKHKITNITIPESLFSKYAFISAITINGRWFIKFNFLYNKNDAQERLYKAESFFDATKAATDNDVKSYNLFHALEQAIHAYFLLRPEMKNKIKKSKKHRAIKKDVNLDTKLGNFPERLKDLFNSLLGKRKAIYDENVKFQVTNKDVKEVNDFIEYLKKLIRQN